MGFLSALADIRAAVAPPIRDARRYYIRDRQGRYWSGKSWVSGQQRARVVTGQDRAWEIVDEIAPDDEDIFLSEIRA